MKKRNLLLSVLFLLAACTLHAQDTHFSQYNATPLSINPALTGIYDGTFRFTNTYRSQWGGLGKGYSTVYSSLDFPMGKTKQKNHYWGAGLVFNTDKAGEIGYYTTQVQASVAFTTALNEYATHFISFGTQVGLSQK
jgi:type IX secretion system PorP/SprF family membrane protein